MLAAETDLQLKQIALSDVTGLQPDAMLLLFPAPVLIFDKVEPTPF